MQGFQRFRADIDTITADIGGGSRAREAVGQWFAGTLRLIQGNPPRDQGHYRWADWYDASDTQLEAAAQQATAVLSRRPDEEETARSSELYRGGRIVVFQRRAMLVSPNGYYIPLASICESSKYDSRAQKMVPDFMISMDNPGKTLSVDNFGSTRPSSTHAKSNTAAYNSLRSMVEKSFGVTLENIG